MTVRQILQTKPSGDILTIRPGDSVADAARILSDKRIGALVVSADGSGIDGILSERDIVRELGKRGSVCLEMRVDELMTAKVMTADPRDTAVEVLTKMTDGRFRHLPVLEEGTMVGVISIGDVVKHRIAEIESENSALTDMIVGHG